MIIITENSKVKRSYSYHLLKLIFLFYLNLCFSEIRSQSSNNLDSLKNILSSEADNKEKIKTLDLITQGYLQINPSKSLIYADQLQEISSDIDYVAGIIKAYTLKTQIYRKMYSYDTSLLFCDKAISMADSIGNKEILANLYANKGHTLFITKGPKTGIDYYRKSYNLFNEISDSSGMSNSLNGNGAMYMRMSVYDSAVYYFMELVNISEKLGYKTSLGKGYLNLGISYIELGNLDKASLYFNKSIPINEQNKRSDFICMAYNGLGNVSRFQKNLEDALNYYNYALKQNEKINDKIGAANIYNNIGNTYEQKGNLDQALIYYNKSNRIFEQASDRNGFLSTYINIGLINRRNGNYYEALEIFDSCLVIGSEIGSLYNIQEVYINIYSTYELLQNYKKAFEYQTLYNELKDSIFNIEKVEIISELEIKYEKEKDQAQILALENENLAKDLSLRKRTNQRNIYLFSGIGTITIILFLFIFYRHKARKDKIIAEQKIQQLEEEKKLLAAKFLVEGQEEERKRIAKELHDGLGVLLSTTKIQFTSIKDKSPENKEIIDKATKMLEQATGDVRKIAHNMMPGLLTRFGLFEAAEDLLENLNETEGLTAICEISGDSKRLPENKEIMLYRIIQEMVNNSIKHAEATAISLKMEILPELMKIQFLDNGKGFNVEEKLQSKSIGLNSIQSRVNFLSGKVDIESKPGAGASYFIHIPI